MISFQKELWFNVQERMDFINITRDVESALSESGIKEGLCLVNAMPVSYTHLTLPTTPYV